MGNDASRSATKKPLLSSTSQSINELYVQHQEAVVAAWSQESCCTYIMRMAGLENGISSTEKRKEMQHYHPFIPGHHQHIHTIDSQLLEQYGFDPTAHEAILCVQKFYRSYRAISRFQDCIWTLVLSLRKDAQRKQELINAVTFLKNFRNFLTEGFLVSKFSTKSQVWKSIQVECRKSSTNDETYDLCWSNSLGSDATISPHFPLHTLEGVVDVAEDFETMPNLLQLTSAKDQVVWKFQNELDRDLVYRGMTVLLTQLVHVRTKTAFDKDGVLRPKTKELVRQFFEDAKSQTSISRKLAQEQVNRNPQGLEPSVVVNTSSSTKFSLPLHELEERYNTPFDQYAM